MRVIYYYYFLFYTKIIPDKEPHSTVVFTLSLSETFLFVYSADMIGAYAFCSMGLNNTGTIIAWITITVINYLVFYRSGVYKEIEEEKPKYFNNGKLSASVAIAFGLICVSTPFWVTDYVLSVLENCN